MPALQVRVSDAQQAAVDHVVAQYANGYKSRSDYLATLIAADLENRKLPGTIAQALTSWRGKTWRRTTPDTATKPARKKTRKPIVPSVPLARKSAAKKSRRRAS